MSPKPIQKRVLQHPFQTFRIFLSDGATYEVEEELRHTDFGAWLEARRMRAITRT